MSEFGKQTKSIKIQTAYGPNGTILLKVVHYYSFIWALRDDFSKSEILTISQLATAINLSDKDLIDMLAKFHGRTYNSKQYPAITFKNLQSAKEAKEWLESLLMMHTLVKE
jgi:hypothetical protein